MGTLSDLAKSVLPYVIGVIAFVILFRYLVKLMCKFFPSVCDLASQLTQCGLFSPSCVANSIGDYYASVYTNIAKGAETVAKDTSKAIKGIF